MPHDSRHLHVVWGGHQRKLVAKRGDTTREVERYGMDESGDSRRDRI